MEYLLKGCESLGRFNLLDEPWIRVIVDENAFSKEVSLIDVFENAHNYKGLAGEMETQDFALMRVLLSVMHTVFSRFNAQGEVYEYLDLDDKFLQRDEVDEDDLEEYCEKLYETWFNLWEAGSFPSIICEYLEKWRDRFYLFDEKYPFFQIRAEDVSSDKINKSKPSSVSGKNINRLLSESGNKIALFSYKNDFNKNKEKLSEAEIIRWLITFQSYTGLSDKVIFGQEKYKSSKGWLFDLGGIYFKGRNLFETLMLNFVIAQKDNDYIKNIQRPSWEYESIELIGRYFDENNIDNIASLYTAWSRGIYINPEINVEDPFEFFIVKLPDINHQDNFLEPMTVWKYNENGENKDKYTPKKHIVNKAMWRSFGLLTIESEGNRIPGVVQYLNRIKELARDNNININASSPVICAVSMKDDGNATSWVPTDEIIDYLSIDEYVLTDLQEDGWVVRINEVVEQNKRVVNFIFRNYMLDIKAIRNVKDNAFVNKKVEEVFFKIDHPFRQWLAGICLNDEKDKKISEWRNYLKKFIILEAEEVLEAGSFRDYKGIEKDGKIKNIATAYNMFRTSLNKEL